MENNPVFKLSAHVIVLLVFVGFGCSSLKQTTTTQKPAMSGIQYIEEYKDYAIREMRKTGIPASIKLAQGMLESNYGNSTLARDANNHFGIKCHKSWKGGKIYHDDDRKNECFRVYNNPYESFRDHSEFLTGYQRYAFLFKYDPTDYKSWAKGLKKAGYATSPTYAHKLIDLIERYRLYNYDAGPTSQVRYAEHENTRDQQLGNVDNFTINAPGHTVQTRNRIDYIIVRKGDSFRSLNEELDLLPWELEKYNDLGDDTTTLQPGQILYLQPKRNKAARGYDIHVVKDGDTMHSISQLYGIKLEKLYEKNHMEEGVEPDPGTKIYLRKDKPMEKEEPGIKMEESF